MGGPEVPFLQEGLSGLQRLVPELLEVHPDMVGPGRF